MTREEEFWKGGLGQNLKYTILTFKGIYIYMYMYIICMYMYTYILNFASSTSPKYNNFLDQSKFKTL